MLNTGVLLQHERYRILQSIGGGGMGQVYLAEDLRLAGRRCAMKEFSPEQIPPQDRTWATQTFQQEAAILSNLDHPGLTKVFDYFAEGSNQYLVMELVDGETLDKRLDAAKDRRLPQAQALDITLQLCDVLEYLHRCTPPIVFRDLKPGNIMLTRQGQVKLIDFGIARLFKAGQSRDTINLGTPGYAAPEQYGGQGQTDPRSDVYSLGVVLYEMLTGYDPTQTPFNLPVTRTLNITLPTYIETVIRKATQVDPNHRYQTIAELRMKLTGQAAPVSRNRFLLPALLGALVVLLLGGALLLSSNSNILGGLGINPTATATATAAALPTAVPTATATRTSTPTFTPTETREPTATPRSVGATETETLTPTVARVAPTRTRVINTRVPPTATQPACPSGQFWDDIMKRCKNSPGGGGGGANTPAGP
jgi:serine/threonine protein kinase, bacterial